MGSILYDVYGHAGTFDLKCFALKCKDCIGLVPLVRIDPTVLAPGRTSDVGQGQCKEKFFMVSRSVGRRGVGKRRALSDGGRTEVLTSL